METSGDFDTRLERSQVARLVWDNAINIDSRHLLGHTHGEDERREEDDTDHHADS